jgi:hypothetical protein
MYVVIGGEERAIEQVDSFVEYYPDKVINMSAKEIFKYSRAGKLFDKVLQNNIDELAIELAEGNSIVLSPIVHPGTKSFTGGAIEKAKKLEYFYAEQASSLNRG